MRVVVEPGDAVTVWVVVDIPTAGRIGCLGNGDALVKWTRNGHLADKPAVRLFVKQDDRIAVVVVGAGRARQGGRPEGVTRCRGDHQGWRERTRNVPSFVVRI